MNINPPSGGLHLPFFKSRASTTKERRLPGFEWLPNKVRNHFIAMLGEFSGTFLFLFFAFSATQVANATTSNTSQTSSGSLSQGPNPSVLMYISLAFGFSLAVNAWVFFRISGGLFNPAVIHLFLFPWLRVLRLTSTQVTLGMCLIGAVNWTRGGLIFISQILGATASAGVVSALFPGALNVATTLSPGTTIVRGLFIEMFLTSMLVLTIFMLAAEKHKGTFLAPVGIGLALFIAELSGMHTLRDGRLPLLLLTLSRCFLHGRVFESREILWPMRRFAPLPRLPLALLGGTSPRILSSCRILPPCQSARV